MDKKQLGLKILIIRFSSIGDIVLTTPVIRCLKKQLKAEIHFLTKKSYQGVIVANPHLDKIFSIDKKVIEVLPKLKAENYDLIVDLHNNLRSRQVKWVLKAKSKTFDKINRQKWLMVNLKVNRLPVIHIVDRYLKTVKDLGVVNDYAGLDYFIPPTDELKLPNAQIPFLPLEFVALVIGAAHATKRLPQPKITQLCQITDRPIVLLGGPAEQEIGEEIARQAGSKVINAAGKFNLNQSASIVRQAQLVITHDTGLMHIAAAFQKRIYSIWGNTIPAFGMYPYYQEGLQLNTSIEVEGLSCRPCSKIGYAKCPKGHFKCMEAIGIENLSAQIQEETRRLH